MSTNDISLNITSTESYRPMFDFSKDRQTNDLTPNLNVYMESY